MHSRESSIQILDMSDFDELADFADLFTVPPTSTSSKFSSSRSPFSPAIASTSTSSVFRPESIAYPSGIPLELDLFDDEAEYLHRASPSSESGESGSGVRAGIRMSTADTEGILAELNMDKDDSISPTLPTFDMRTRVSRDQTEIRAPSPSSSSTSTSSSSLGSMPIILEMRPGETILESHDDAMRREHSFGTASKDPRGGAAAGRSSRYRSRPASLATTLRPRRASTGAGLSDWISMYDPQTPTAIVDLERMASGFPLIPQGVDEEEDVEDGLSGGTSRVTGLPRGLDHDRLDSITSWQRDCCINSTSISDSHKDLRRIVSWDPTTTSNEVDRLGELCSLGRIVIQRQDSDRPTTTRSSPSSSSLLLRTRSLPDLETAFSDHTRRQFHQRILQWLPDNNMSGYLQVETGLQIPDESSKDIHARRSPRMSTYSASNRHLAPPQLPRVPEESSLTDIQFSSPPQLPLRQLPVRSSAHSIHSSRSVDTSYSIPSLALSHTEFSPSTSTSTDTGLMTSSSSGSGTFGSKARLIRHPLPKDDAYSARESVRIKAYVRGQEDERDEEGGLYANPLREIDFQRPVSNKSNGTRPDASPRPSGHSSSLQTLTKDLGSDSKGLSTPHGDLQATIDGSTTRSYRFPITPDGGSPLFFDVTSVLEKGFDCDKENDVSSTGNPDEKHEVDIKVDPYSSNVKSLSSASSRRGTGASGTDTDVHSIFATSSASYLHGRRNQQGWESGDKRFVLEEPIRTVNDHIRVERSGSISTTASKSTQSLTVPSNNTTIRPLHLSYNPSSRRSSLAATQSDSGSAHPFASRNSPNPTTSGSFEFYNHHTGMNSPGTLGSARGMTHSISMPQVTLVAPEDMEKLDDEVCVICCESLNPLYRLAGEKPNVTSACGHSLHHACFTAVYGPVKLALSRRDLGVCGVCRQPMRLDQDEMFQGGGNKGGGNDKFAAMMGLEGSNGTNRSRRGNNITTSSRGQLPSEFTKATRSPMVDAASMSSFASSADKNEQEADDPVDVPRKTSGSGSMIPQVVVPTITVKAEHSIISKRVDNAKRGLTCMITVQVPPSGRRPFYKSRDAESPASIDSHSGMPRARTMGGLSSAVPATPDSSVPPSSARSLGPDPFAHVAADLKHRLADFKSSGLDTLGWIRLFDILQVRKGQFVLDIMVFLYDMAIVCVAEEKKRGLKSLLSSSSSSNNLRGGDDRNSKKSKAPLKLKGRIYFRDVSRIVDSSLAGELSVTIQMKATNIESFILVFRDKSAQSLWMNTLNMALAECNGASSAIPMTPVSPPNSGISSKLARMGIQEQVVSATQFRKESMSSAVSLQTTSDVSVAKPLAPVHTPLDLVIVVPVPSMKSPASASTTLKLDLVSSTLNFIVASLGNHDRICIVAYQAGFDGWVKRTPFLNATRYESRKRLDKFVLSLVDNEGDTYEEFAVPGTRDEQIDIVSAVNASLDNTLQRKGKNPISGMIVVSDTGGIPSRSSMDLVIARLEAANVPIHAVGFTKSHEPSPLWLLSNATHGTYVSLTHDWNQLRDVCAGILGGLMSIVMGSVKLSLSATVPQFRIRRIQGAQSTMISTDGHTSEVDLGHLVSGSKIEVLVDLERERSGSVDENGDPSDDDAHSAGSSLHQVQKTRSITNAEPHSADSNLNQMWEEGALEEIPLLSVDCQYMDPAARRQIARLSDPRLLMITLSASQPSKQVAAPEILRRKAELLASESMTRAVLLVSRNNWAQARRIISETSKILAFNLSNAMNSIPNTLQRATPSAIRKETEARVTTHLYSAILEDLDVLGEGCDEEVKEVFERDQRTYSAQQALILRKQLSWTSRSATEQLYITEGSQELLGISRSWSQR